MDYVSRLRKHAPEALAAIPGLLTVLGGALHYGWSSPAIQQFQSGNETLTLKFEESSRLITMLGIGNIIGPFGLLLTADIFGRKIAMLAADIPILLGWILIACATNVHTLYVARLLAGAGFGLSLAIAPLYLGEIASDSTRGALCTLPQVMVALGPILEYAVVPFLRITTSAILSAVIPLVTLPMLYWMPESPYYLLMKNRRERAHETLQVLRENKNVDEEFEKVVTTLEHQMVNKPQFKDLFVQENCLRGLLLVCGVLTIFVMSGVHMIMAYSHLMLGNISEEIPRNGIALTMVILVWIGGIISSSLIDTIGKKPLLFVSALGCMITTFIVALFFHLKHLNYDTDGWKILPIICLVAFQFFNGLALSSFGFVYLGELLSANIKMYAATIAQCYVCIVITIQNELYQVVFAQFGFYFPFYVFAVGNFIGLLYLFVLPETKGRSLHEIQLMLGAKFEAKTASNITLTTSSSPSNDIIPTSNI